MGVHRHLCLQTLEDLGIFQANCTKYVGSNPICTHRNPLVFV